MASPDTDDEEQADTARATAATRASRSMGAVRRWRLTRFASLGNARTGSQSRQRARRPSAGGQPASATGSGISSCSARITVAADAEAALIGSWSWPISSLYTVSLYSRRRRTTLLAG